MAFLASKMFLASARIPKFLSGIFEANPKPAKKTKTKKADFCVLEDFGMEI